MKKPTKIINGIKYGFGLECIMDMFSVSRTTAWRLCDGPLAPAIKKEGRLIMVDMDKAYNLFGGEKKQ